MPLTSMAATASSTYCSVANPSKSPRVMYLPTELSPLSTLIIVELTYDSDASPERSTSGIFEIALFTYVSVASPVRLTGGILDIAVFTYCSVANPSSAPSNAESTVLATNVSVANSVPPKVWLPPNNLNVLEPLSKKISPIAPVLLSKNSFSLGTILIAAKLGIFDIIPPYLL